MRAFNRNYRNDQKFRMQRLDRLAGNVNVILLVVALGLAALNVICAAQRIVESLPPVVQASLGGPR